MRRLVITGAVLLLLCLHPPQAGAFAVGSAFSDFCHEKISMNAYFGETPLPNPQYDISVPQDQAWIKIAKYLESRLNVKARNDLDRMALISLFIGARYPDQQGFAIFDIKGLREIHMSAQDQYAHSLRSPYDDYENGDRIAIHHTWMLINRLVQYSHLYYHAKDKSQRVQQVDFWLEHYGRIKVKVWMPLFLLGRAAHALQDSFSHTYRSTDTKSIYAVCNYLDGISKDYDEARDGPKHSDFLDICNEPEIKPLTEAATRATRELMGAVGYYWKTGKLERVVQVLDKHLAYKAGCGYARGYCDSRWAELGKRAESSAPLSCNLGHSPAECLLVLGALAAIRLRQRAT